MEPRWEETLVINRAMKEALHIRLTHIQLTPKGQCFNGDVRLELPDCWVSTIKVIQMKLQPSLSV